jgi:hypothetical protein
MRHDRWGGGTERTWGQRAFIVGALLVKVLLLYLIFG